MRRALAATAFAFVASYAPPSNAQPTTLLRWSFDGASIVVTVESSEPHVDGDPVENPAVLPRRDVTGPLSVEDEVLALTNARRAQGAVCGNRAFASAPPLVTQPLLRSAARMHSQDMGARNYFEHSTPEGRTPNDRMRAAGYEGGYTGENIYGGPRTAAEVVDGWMKSPGHCVNIMNPKFRRLGVGYAYVPGSKYGYYWTQDFGDR